MCYRMSLGASVSAAERDTPAPDDEQSRGQPVLPSVVHRHSMGAPTPPARIPTQASALAIAWKRHCRFCLIAIATIVEPAPIGWAIVERTAIAWALGVASVVRAAFGHRIRPCGLQPEG
jgi:hypothetical protein